MTTRCPPLNTSFLAFPCNFGVSPSAGLLERLAKELLDIFDQSITMGQHYKETLKIIDKAIKEHSIDNWDGYGAQAVDTVSCANALWFSRLLPMQVPVPEIYIDPDGEVTFEWYIAPRKVFSVTVRGNKELAYAGLFGANKTHGTESLYDEVPETILEAISRVLSE